MRLFSLGRASTVEGVGNADESKFGILRLSEEFHVCRLL
jgi:hypothetical protein